MITATLYSKSLREKGYCKLATTSFPASRYDLALAFAKARITGPEDCAMRFDRQSYPQINAILKLLPQNGSSLDELNFFAKRFVDMDVTSRSKVLGMIRMTPPDSYMELISLMYNLDHVLLINAGSYAKLGRYLVDMNEAEIDKDADPVEEYTRIGKERVINHDGVFILGGYAEYTTDPFSLPRLRDGGALPCNTQGDDWVFRLVMEKFDADGNEIEDNGIYVYLPYYDPMLEQEVELGNVNNFTDKYGYTMTGVETHISAFDGVFDENTDIGLLNSLAAEIGRMDDAGFVKFIAVLEHERARLREKTGDVNVTLAGKHLFCALDYKNYDLDPRIVNAEDYAKNILYRADVDPVLADHIDYHSYGLAKLEEAGAEVGSYGLIRPKEPRQEEAQKSGQNEGMNMNL